MPSRCQDRAAAQCLRLLRSRRRWRWAGLSAAAAGPRGSSSSRRQTPLIWPGPPERERIRYVGQLATSADLKPAVSFGQQMHNVFLGKDPDRSMLTPFALCTDGADRLFVADSNAQIVHVFDLKTRKYAQWCPANAEKRFSQPVGIAYDR